MPTTAIRPARSEDLPAAAALLAANLGFADRDAVPAWLMRTTDRCGGLTLVALSGDAVVGVSYAIAGRDEEAAFLFSCGLAVHPAHRGRELGLQLKLEQRRLAIARGYETIRWTTDPINGRALRVYLSHLGALVTAYRAGLHDGLRADRGHPLDDLELIWPLGARPALDPADVRLVEIPWSTTAAEEAAHRRRVRAEMSALLSEGYVGAEVDLDRGARRCWIRFARVPA
jgi:predicted GNAT superfamily acetyltransferase